MNFKKLALTAAIVSVFACGSALATTQVDSTMTVDATLVTACQVSATSAIHFNSINALLSTGDKTANSGSSFQVACSAGASSPTIFASGPRSMSNGTDSLPFNLSLTSGAGSDDLPTSSGTATTFTLTKDGTLYDVPIYGKVLATNFAGLSSGAYTTDVTVSVVY